jgi:MFS family permease
MGGILTDAVGWEWNFFVNVPVGIAALALTPRLLSESRDARVKSFDAAGAVLVTVGLSTLVYAITQAGQEGWLAGTTVAFFAAALVLLVGFVAWELRHPEPLMRLGIFRLRTVAGANVASFMLNITTLSTFVTLTLYMQQVLGYSAMKTGLAFLAIAGNAIVSSTIAAQLVTRIGVKAVLVTGLTALAAGILYLTQIAVDGSYVADLLPGFLLIALGVGFSFVPISIAALAGVESAEAGLASGLINTSQQIGSAVGIAALSAIATPRTDDALAGGATQASALVTGFQGAFVVAVIVAGLAIAVALTLIRRDELEQSVAYVDAEPALDLAA